MRVRPITEAESREIAGVRLSERRGSGWDAKIHRPTGLTYPELREEVGEAAADGRAAEIAVLYGVSISFVRKWARVFAAKQMLEDKDGNVLDGMFSSVSNRPKKTAGKITGEVEDSIVRARRKYPFFGSAKIRILVYEETGTAVSHTCIDSILKRNGLIRPRCGKDVGNHRFERPHSMDLWQIDFKRWENGIHHIWILDDHSRAILAFRMEKEMTMDVVTELLDSAVERYGKPKEILTDRGKQFSKTSSGGKSELEEWCSRQGIVHTVGSAGHPQTRGKVERSHRSAMDEIGIFGSMDTPENAEKAISEWVSFYNTQRPHQGIGYGYPLVRFLSDMDDRGLSGLVCGGPGKDPDRRTRTVLAAQRNPKGNERMKTS